MSSASGCFFFRPSSSASRSRPSPSTSSCASLKNSSRALSVPSPRPPPSTMVLRAAEGRFTRPRRRGCAHQLRARVAQLFGREGFRKVCVGAEGDAALYVLLAAQARDDDQRRRAVVLGLPDEPNELEPVDVRSE